MVSMAELSSRLCGQYLLVPGDCRVSLPTWQVRQLGDWALHFSHPLPITEIVDDHGRAIGVLLGHALHDPAGLVAGVLRLPVHAAHGGAVQQAVEQWRRATGGRYLAIILQPQAYIYPDAGAFLPAYRCSRSGAVSSSPQLAAFVAGANHSDAQHEEMRVAMDIPRKNSWFPFGLTPCPTVTRLLPNHHLDLRTGATSRHWLPPAENKSFDAAVDVVTETLRQQTQYVLGSAPAYLSLTAGYDSRVVLAACREQLDRVTCYTVDSDEVDVNISRQITAQVGAAHFVQTRQRSRADDLEKWLQRTGYCIAGAGPKSLIRRPTLDPEKAVLGGFGGEVCRGFYWDRVASLDASLDADKLIAALGLPTSPLLQQAADNWLSGTSRNLSTRDVLDLAYIEQRLGCWAAPQQLAEPFIHGRFHLLVHPKIFEAMLSIPAEQRGGTELNEAVIERLWPSLLQIPFNPKPRARPLRKLATRALGHLPAPIRTPLERGWQLAKSLR